MQKTNGSMESNTVSRDEAFCLDFHWYSNNLKNQGERGWELTGGSKKYVQIYLKLSQFALSLG